MTHGQLDIGDADHWDTLQLPADVWQAQVTARPADAPDEIEIVLSPLHPQDHPELDS